MNLWRVTLEGKDVRQLTTGDSDFNGTISPDDKWIVFISMASGKRLLHKIDIAGGHDIILSPIPIYESPPAVSPDGKLVAFLFTDGARQRYRCAVIRFEGSDPIAIFDAPGRARVEWTRDGKGLTYISSRGGVDNLSVQPLAGGPPRQITSFSEGRIFRFAWRFDGRLIAVAHGEETSDIVSLQRTN